jgi:hypothetical protein
MPIEPAKPFIWHLLEQATPVATKPRHTWNTWWLAGDGPDPEAGWRVPHGLTNPTRTAIIESLILRIDINTINLGSFFSVSRRREGES